MNYFYITGTSRGLGKAIAEELLQGANNYVYGYSRGCSIEHPNYEHHNIDLSIVNDISNVTFNSHNDGEKIVLINNSGTLGEVNYVGRLADRSISEGFIINLIAPGVLMNNFIKAYSGTKTNKLIINISSGAAQNPIDGWNVYCSSKAALDMYSEVVGQEQDILSSEHPIKILSVAPGLVNTKMQDDIREVPKANFSRLEDFYDYHKNSELISPDDVAKKIMKIIDDPDAFEQVVISVRDMA